MGKEYFTFEEEEIYENSDAVISKLPKDVKETYGEMVDLYSLKLLKAMSECKSQIEMLMAIQLEQEENYFLLRCVYHGLNISHTYYKQMKYEFGNKTYVADFSIHVVDWKTNKETVFIIECDGHDFHEKTKQQVMRDKERDREFIKNGYVVIRFTGAEIVNKNCAVEVYDIIANHMKDERR